MKAGACLLLTVTLLVAGCARQDVEPPGIGPLASPFISELPTTGFEPSVGLASTGDVFVNAATYLATGDEAPGVWRSADGGQSWQEVMTGDDRIPGSFDPWLWLDPATDRVFSAELQLACAWMSWSDDLGTTWETNPAGGCGLPVHHFQKLTGGPPPQGMTTQGYPNVLYYSSSSLRDPDPANPGGLIVGGTGSDIATSMDGGRTFGLAMRVHPPTPGGYSQAGPVAIGRDGTAWSPAQTDAGVRIAASRDAGRSWELAAYLVDAGYQPMGSDPSLAVDPGGILYLLHPSADSQPVLRASRDAGSTWTDPVTIAPAGVTATIFERVVALGNGTVAAAYVGTTAPSEAWGSDPSFAPPSVAWHLYLTLVTDADTDSPKARSVIAEVEPVQRGCIWMRGGIESPCRNHGDFLGMDARDGLVVVAFLDGCDDCPADVQSTGNDAKVAYWRPVAHASG